MTDKDYSDYGKNVHREIYAMSTQLIDSVAGKVLTRIRKEQAALCEMPAEWTRVVSISVDVIDVLSVHAHKGRSFIAMSERLEDILDRYIADRYDEIDERTRLLLKYRYVGESHLAEEVKKRIHERLNEHYATGRMKYLLERFPDLDNV